VQIMSDSLRYVQLTYTVAASPQVQPADMAAIAAAGYRVVVNNRPDGEALDQPTSEQLRVAADAAGLTYHYYPLNAFNYPGPDVAAMAAIFDDLEKPIFAFCRSGTRSTNLWVSTRETSAQPDSRKHAQQLGFDVSMSIR
jgi:uncharacterized protein (TIGR01244 family)